MIIGFQLLSEPDHTDIQKCTAIAKGETQWSSKNCDESKGFLCRFKSSKHIFVFKFSINPAVQLSNLKTSSNHRSLHFVSFWLDKMEQ
jgi:hypothetical protein